MTRRKLLAANWKMYKTPAEAQAFCREFLPLITGFSGEVALCPAAVCIPATVAAVKGSPVRVGAQNVHWEKEGAFTGELSTGMLLAGGCTHVIIGHSERRQYFGETDATVNKRLAAALESGLTPICCVGEMLEERQTGLTDEVLRRQCAIAFRGISGERAEKLTIAYEPVWAIGTGHTATPEIAQEAHLTIRSEAANAFGQQVADDMRILYGGSVKPENAQALMAQPDIDGALVGGASLDPKSFAAICKASA
jgi:triosephosphate isomerase